MRILVINLGWEQAPLIEYVAGLNRHELYGIHDNNESHGAHYFKEIAVIGFRDLKKIIEYADAILPEAIVSDQCDYSLFAQALLAHRYNLPGPALDAAQLSNNKYLQRMKSRDAGIDIPEFELCWMPDQVREFATKHGFPVILKPVDNRGSFGVIKIDHAGDTELAFSNSIIHSHSRTLLVEVFIEGIHITIDGYAFPEHGIKSLALASKKLDPNNQVALEIVYPGELSDEQFNKALDLNESINKKLGYSFGMTHSEYMIRENEIFLIESANRGGGVFTSEVIVPCSAGIDLLCQYVSDCIGDEIELFEPPKHNGVVLRFFSFQSGKVKHIFGWDNVCVDSNVLRCDLFVKPGDMIGPITNDANRHGFIIYEGTIKEANSLLSRIKVIYEE